MHRGWNCGDYFADGITNGASWYSLSKGKGWAGEHHPQQGVELNRGGGIDEKPQDRMGWGRAVAVALCPLLDTILVAASQTGKWLGKTGSGLGKSHRNSRGLQRTAVCCWTKEALIC